MTEATTDMTSQASEGSANLTASGGSLPLDAETRADRQLLSSALRKMTAKQELNRDEQAALRRYEKKKEERLRWEYYGSIPQKHWRQMSGRQTKVINEQASRYNLPFGGPTVDLSKLARAIHDFLADNALKLARDEDPLMQGGASPALEKYREERAAIARLDRLEREGGLLPRQPLRQALGKAASIIRNSGEKLQQQFGPAAAAILYEALDDAKRELERSVGDNDDAGDTSN